MKKILCILTIFLLASCNCEENERVPEIRKSRVHRYTYEGHKYLTFGSFEAIIHDPDCPCHNNY